LKNVSPLYTPSTVAQANAKKAQAGLINNEHLKCFLPESLENSCFQLKIG
jgi:hypothetical protein